MEGWIKIHRKLLDWEWWDSSDTLKVFLYLLLTGNLTDKLWHGVSLKRGQLVTSYSTVSQQTKIPYQTVRTIFERLKSTGEITVKTTNKYSIVTINNFNQYQPINRQAHSQSTGNQQATNRQLTTAKEYKEYKEYKERKNNNTIPKGIVKQTFRNEDVNFLLSYLKEKLNLPILDESEKVNRQYCWLAIKKFGGRDKVKLLIEATSQHEFWSTRITSFKQLYYKAVNIISSGRDIKHSVTKL